jgi:hypothetical protein
MKHKIIKAFILTPLGVWVGTGGAQAFGQNKIDLSPQSFSFRAGIGDDVTNLPVQYFRLHVTNKGNKTFKATGPMAVRIAGRTHSLYIYGPSAGGAFLLGGPIQPGQSGFLSGSVAPNTFSHCQRLPVQIDVNKQLQSGPGVFLNDSANLIAFNSGSDLPCLFRPITETNLNDPTKLILEDEETFN